MTSAEIRRSCLDFFRAKGHTVAPSSSLQPDVPHLLFTRAGGDPFASVFRGEKPFPYDPPRAVSIQKCLRAGGPQDDLELIGLDTHHHSFFEMLGNRSFGDGAKAEAIGWAWELLVDRWKFPPNRLYATVYKPSEGDPGAYDEETFAVWSRLFASKGLDPRDHLIFGRRKENFRMTGETGPETSPCGPCSDIHIDLTPAGLTKGSLVNKGDPRCIKIWNLHFIQYNANGDGTFPPLPACYVDTGMGFERICSILQGTDGFRFFDPRKISNYALDSFKPYFSLLEQVSGKRYGATVPAPGTQGGSEEERVDIAFRVIADHVRALCFAVADGILPSGQGRGYVLRRILCRAVRSGRVLNFHGPFLHQLIPIVAKTMGEVYPEIARDQAILIKTIRAEEETFSKALDRGLDGFKEIVAACQKQENGGTALISGAEALKLYDSCGFPLDLTQLLARERGMEVDIAGFNALMEERAQANRKKDSVAVGSSDVELAPTLFVGYETFETLATVLRVDAEGIVVDKSPFFAEIDGQIGDSGRIYVGDTPYLVENTTRTPEGYFLHKVRGQVSVEPGNLVGLHVDEARRGRIAIHHSAAHLLFWALRDVLGSTIERRGSYVAPEQFHVDFACPEELSDVQLAEIERRMAVRVKENAPLFTNDRLWDELKYDRSIFRLPGETCEETVRFVEIGDYSKELCRGTHVARIGEVGFIKIILEGPIAEGIRRIEAVAEQTLTEYILQEVVKQDARWQHLREKNTALSALPEFKPADNTRESWARLLARQENIFIAEAKMYAEEKEASERLVKSYMEQAEKQSVTLLPKAQERNAIPTIIEDIGEKHPDYLPYLVEAVNKRWCGVLVVASQYKGRVDLAANVAESYRQIVNADALIRGIAPLVKGNGGGKAAFARGSGAEPKKISSALKEAANLIR